MKALHQKAYWNKAGLFVLFLWLFCMKTACHNSDEPVIDIGWPIPMETSSVDENVMHPDFDVKELIGKATGSSAEIFVLLGEGDPRIFSFKMGFDSSSHASDHNYSEETPEQSGKGATDKLTFSIASGLSLDTKYYYSVAYKKPDQEEWTWRRERFFHTARAKGSSFRFCIISDYHYYGTARLLSKWVKNVETDAPDFVINLGDMAIASGQGYGDPVDCNQAYMPLLQGADFFYKSYAYKIMGLYGHSALNIWVNGNHEGVAGYLTACDQRQALLDAQKMGIGGEHLGFGKHTADPQRWQQAAPVEGVEYPLLQG